LNNPQFLLVPAGRERRARGLSAVAVTRLGPGRNHHGLNDLPGKITPATTKAIGGCRRGKSPRLAWVRSAVRQRANVHGWQPSGESGGDADMKSRKPDLSLRLAGIVNGSVRE